MSKKVLVLGGTRYFGRHLIEDLLAKKYEVIVATRGNTSTTFSKPVQFVTADRLKIADLKSLVQNFGPFDIIFDQVCMSGQDAENAVEAFGEFCQRYIFTSTGSVYDFKNDSLLLESNFDPKTYKINLTPTNSYQENKRQAEAVFSLQKTMPVTMVRFPIVLGEDDYTGRLKFHVQKILKGEEIFIPRLATKMAFINSIEAGKFLSFMGDHVQFTGPVNAASNGTVSLLELVTLIENACGKKAQLASVESASNASPFGSELDFILSNDKATSLGFSFLNLHDYLPRLINLIETSLK